MEAKKQLLKQTFETAFDMKCYERFIIEFFNTVEIVAPYNKITNYLSEFSFNIISHSHVANYTDHERNRIAILAVELKTGKNVERARSAQRNFVSKLISANNYDAAIVAFYTEKDTKWRLSFVKLDQEWLGEGKVKTTITPAKRYSYLVGVKEPCHTAKEQLFPIFKEENFKPTLAKIEEAFSVEAVTDEFFKEYKEKYHELREHLEKSEEFLEAAEKHEFTSEQFAKKLMGQLAFLYFIQKKGWLGVKVVKKSLTVKEYKNAYYQTQASKTVIPKAYEQKELDLYKLKASALTGDYLTDDEADILASCFKSEPWGSGTKSFIRDLFKSCVKSGKNFFEDFLEPLFYEALSIKRGEHHYYKRFNCKIPFLNGGLFDPIENYDWKYSKFDIPNGMFSTRTENDDRNGSGILDVFERYNFTMNEDEPLEREVAVDPEMLGKIFENLLDSDDRKSKGAFYTPREIVHYMCQESLINYLLNETAIPYEDLKQFILYGEIMKDEDCANTMNLKNEDIRRLPKTVFDNLREIDIALENVKIADPAVGSGAFPLGMLSEIVKARENITAYVAAQIINQNKNTQKSQRAAYYESRAPYKIKWKTIKNSIYGVDIEASAVDIAKLRLWLSLIVDEDLTPSYNDICCGITTQIDPKPLPNLDFNIMCGNSLIDEFDGIKLFDDSLFDKDESGNKKQSKNMQITLFQDQMELQIEKLFNEQDRLFGENNTDNKKYLKKEIDKTIDHIIRSKLTNDGNNEGLEKYEESLKQKTKPYFLWKLEFAKIFKEKGGFDIVIGNPPYGAKFSKKDKQYLAAKYPTVPDYESANYFVEKGYELLRTSGVLSFIIPNMFMSNVFAKKYRATLVNSWSFLAIDNLSSIEVFDSAKVRNCIILFEKERLDFETKLTKLTIVKKNIAISKEKKVSKEKLIELIDNWLNILEQSEEQLIILKKVLENSTPLGELAEISQGLIPYDKYRGHTEETIKNRIWHASYQKDHTYRRELAGKDVDRYSVKWNNEKWISYGEWLAAPRKQEFFTSPRILIREITNPKILAGYTIDEYYNTPSIINCINFTVNTNYILGIVNSMLMTFYHKLSSPKSNKGIFPKILVNDVRKLPIKKCDEITQVRMISYVEQILEKKEIDSNADTSDLERLIDSIVYEIYGLTETEIKIVEAID